MVANKTSRVSNGKSNPVKKAQGGHPTTFTSVMGERICDLIAGGLSARDICPMVGIASSTLFKWLADIPQFSEQYAHAREKQADFYAEQIVAIADELEVETIMQGGQIKFDVSSSAVARNRLRVDARKWYASKLAPKKYGDKSTTEITGKDGAPIQHSLAVSFVKP